MSRKENYFHPVKNLLSLETKEWLLKHFRKYEAGYFTDNEELHSHEFFGYYESLGYKKAKASYERVTNNIKTLVDMSHNWNSRRQQISFYIENNDLNIEEEIFSNTLKEVINEHMANYNQTTVDNTNMAVFHTIHSNPSLFINDNKEMIQQIINIYGGEKAIFLQTKGSGKTLTRHTDPKRKCVITFPLTPEYFEYRDCRYYDSLNIVTEPEPKYTVSYKKIQNPVLLNTQKIHEIGDDLSDKESLCFQIEWHNLDYKDVRKLLSEKGLLTTTGY